MNSFICPNKKLIISLHSKRFHLVSEQRKTGFGRARNEMRAKKWKRGEGEGKEGNACKQTPRFWKPAFAGSDWLTRLVEQYCMCRSKVCVILRGHLWYVTRTLWLLFSLVGKIYSPSFETQSSSCGKIRVSGRLIYSLKCLLDLNN